VRWVTDVGANVINTQPVLAADGTVYVVTSHPSLGADHTLGCLVALSPDGEIRWEVEQGRWIWTTPAIGVDGTVYVGSSLGDLTAVAPDGTIRWAFPASRSIVQSSPTIGGDGVIYVGTSHPYWLQPEDYEAVNGRLVAITPEGRELWSVQVGYWLESSPAIGEDCTIYVPSRYDVLAFGPDGRERWRLPTDAEFLGSSAVIGTDGTIYIGAYSGALLAIDPVGTLKWQVPVPGQVWATPAMAVDGTIYIGGRPLSGGSGEVQAVRPDGSIAWVLPIDGHVDDGPIIDASGTLFWGTRGWGGLLAIDPEGEVVWRFEPPSRSVTRPALDASGILYFGTDDDEVYALGSP
jgi:outer membrane protein assembly factor BamB